MNTGEVLSLWRRVDALARVPVLLAPWRHPALDEDVRAFREVLARVYRAVARVSGASKVVDSSKYAAYGTARGRRPSIWS